MRHLAAALALGTTITLALDVQAAGAADDNDGRPSFADWLQEVRAEALARGIRPEIVEQALDLREPLAAVLERDRTQAETVLPLEAYVSRRVTPAAIRSGRQQLARHRPLLERVAEVYGAPPPVIVAIWGLESSFGRFTGNSPTIAALATLAWDPRRSGLFRRELFSALEILDRGYIEPARMRGSWAGAMGQPQFMPSSYLAYAVDFDGDGRRDIWTSPADIFASIANYLSGHGWVSGRRWGREVRVSPEAARRIAAEVARGEGTCRARREMTVGLPLDHWEGLGVRLPEGGALPRADFPGFLVSGTSRHFLVYGNYDTLLAYNCAHAYALSVALLADAISGGREDY